MDKRDVDIQEINDMIGSTVMTLLIIAALITWIGFGLGRPY